MSSRGKVEFPGEGSLGRGSGHGCLAGKEESGQSESARRSDQALSFGGYVSKNGVSENCQNKIAASTPEIANNLVSEQGKRPCVPEQVENIDWLRQCPVHKHTKFLNDMGLRVKRREPEDQCQRDEDAVAH